MNQQLLRRAWDALDSFKQAYPENWQEDDEQVMVDLMRADMKMSDAQPEQEPVMGVFDYKEHAEGLQRDYDLLLAEYNDLKAQRNEVLEEVAQEFDKMPFGDTSASFAIFVRNMKT